MDYSVEDQINRTSVCSYNPSPDYEAFIKNRRSEIMESVEEAARACGRLADEVTVCAVSKTVDVDAVVAALNAGYTDFGENRPQELERKLEVIKHLEGLPRHAWHMIGNLQSNKINHVLSCAPKLIHSVSSLELARAIASRARVHGCVQHVLLEVNVSGEDSKWGMDPQSLKSSFELFLELGDVLVVDGLMTMAPAGNSYLAQKTFEGLRMLRDSLVGEYSCPDLVELSMGMSEDYKEAITEGATIVRLGRVLFDRQFEFAGN